jgi:SAM-dependent methyltransferase
MSTDAVQTYGWASAHAPASCNYVTPKVLQLVAGLGARRVLDLGCGNGALAYDSLALLHLGRGGFLDGRAGLTYAVLQSIYEYMIQLKLAELSRAAPGAPDAASNQAGAARR